jgi:hypothetical protein
MEKNFWDWYNAAMGYQLNIPLEIFSAPLRCSPLFGGDSTGWCGPKRGGGG